MTDSTKDCSRFFIDDAGVRLSTRHVAPILDETAENYEDKRAPMQRKTKKIGPSVDLRLSTN